MFGFDDPEYYQTELARARHQIADLESRQWSVEYRPAKMTREQKIELALGLLVAAGATVTHEPPNPSCHSGQTVIVLDGATWQPTRIKGL